MQRHTTHDPNANSIRVRDEDDDAFVTVSMPISSTATARDGEAFDADRLRGWVRQIESRQIPLFVDHGRNEMTGSRYSALGKIGRVADGEMDTVDGDTVLRGDLEIADPTDLSTDEADGVGEIEAALRFVKQQAQLGLLTASVGWQEDLDGREVPGDADLLEVSLVGVPSDPSAEQTAAAPTEAATRGFQALPDGDAGSNQMSLAERNEMWREMAEDSPAERAEAALDRIEKYMKRHRRGEMPPAYPSREKHPMTATIEELLRQFAHSRRSVAIEDRIEELSTDGRDRRDVLDRLDTLEDHREGRSPSVDRCHSSDWGENPIQEAVDELRDVIDAKPSQEVDGWGYAAISGGDSR